MDKLSLESSTAYTYDPADGGEGSGCLRDAPKAAEARQRKIDERAA